MKKKLKNPISLKRDLKDSAQAEKYAGFPLAALENRNRI